MTLKDGLVKMFAMVAISDYTIVDTMREALTSFKNVYNMSDNKINWVVSNKKLLTTVIIRIQNDVKTEIVLLF
jgi:hypothetical protein